MNDTNQGAERREEIKLKLEYVKTATSLAIFGTLLFAALQWRAAIATENVARVQRSGTEWRDHLRLFADKPHLRPYFESGLELKPDDANAQLVVVVADLRMHIIDVIMDYQLSATGSWMEHGQTPLSVHSRPAPSYASG
jgi:hypothetical protein